MNNQYVSKEIVANSIDELVASGIRHIQSSGRPIHTTSGPAIQANNVTYVLTDTHKRVHTLRAPTSIKYFSRELYAYLKGSEYAKDGLSDASKFWLKIADPNGKVNSNYGYYVFYQKTPGGKTQFEWVKENIIENPETRQAVININSITHKIPTKDFPCTLGLLFHLDDDTLNLDVSSRSTDVITGLPYDMGFFAFVLELLANTLSAELAINIKPGYSAMHATFTQIYEKTQNKIPEILENTMIESLQEMPPLSDPNQCLYDIYHLDTEPPRTEAIKWIIKNKE